MADAPLDYARYGRQIALPELGAAGQRLLATTAVTFSGDGEALASTLHARAGGQVYATTTAAPVNVPVACRANEVRLGVAAFHAVEAARRVLGEAPREIPESLRERLAR